MQRDCNLRIQRRTRQDKKALFEEKCREVETHASTSRSKDLYKAVKNKNHREEKTKVECS